MIDIDKTKIISPGFYLARNCEICGKNKSRGDHRRCSRLKQKKFVKKKNHEGSL